MPTATAENARPGEANHYRRGHYAGAWPSTWHAGATARQTPGDDILVHSNYHCFDASSRNECWCPAAGGDRLDELDLVGTAQSARTIQEARHYAQGALGWRRARHPRWAQQRAYVEAMDGMLQQTKRAARGFRTVKNFIAIVYLRMPKLRNLPRNPMQAAAPLRSTTYRAGRPFSLKTAPSK